MREVMSGKKAGKRRWEDGGADLSPDLDALAPTPLPALALPQRWLRILA